MSRSGYSDDGEGHVNLWRGTVSSAMRGRRGQRLLRELRDALDAMPTKRLIVDALRAPDGEVCALGALGAARGVEMERLDADDPCQVARAFDVAAPVVQEISWANDEGTWKTETPEERWARVRAWIDTWIKKELDTSSDLVVEQRQTGTEGGPADEGERS